MISMSVKADFAAVIERLDRQLWRQVPFAAAKALTDTARAAQKVATSEIDRVFDRPVEFTRKAIGISYATKQTLTAKVFVKDLQAAYLGLQVSGGTRTPKRRALVIPGQNLPLNQYGNIPKGKIKALLARKDVFSGRVRGIEGIWQRQKKGGVKLLVLYEPKAEYKRRFPFVAITKAEVERVVLPNFRAALQAAIASAR